MELSLRASILKGGSILTKRGKPTKSNHQKPKRIFPRTRKLTRKERMTIGLSVHFCPPGKTKAQLVKALARRYSITKNHCYKLGHEMEEALKDPVSFLIHELGDSSPSSVVSVMVLDEDADDRIILCLATECKCSKEVISRFFEEVFNRSVSPEKIKRVLQKYGEQAQGVNNKLDEKAFPKIKAIAMDEIFQGDQPVLTVVDLDTTYALLISAEKDRTAETWEAKAKLLTALGLDPEIIISDACGSILVTIPKVFEGARAQLDVFHALKDVSNVIFRIIQKVEALINEEGELEDRIKNKVTQTRTKAKLQALRVRVRAGVEKADKVESAYKFFIELLGFSGYDVKETMELLTFFVEELLEIARDDNCAICKDREKCKKCQVCTRSESCSKAHAGKIDGRACMNCPNNRGCQACEKCVRCERPEACSFRNGNGKLVAELTRFLKNLPVTLRFLEVFMEKLDALDRDVPEAFVGIHREVYSLWRYKKWSDPFVEELVRLEEEYGRLMVLRAYKNVEGLIKNSKRASSLVECLNSRIRPVMNSKRKIPAYFMALMKLNFNTRKYHRSRKEERVGHSPIELVIGEDYDFYELLGLKKPTIVEIPKAALAG